MGRKMVQNSDIPNEWWNYWKSHKDQIKSLGISCGKNHHDEWQITKWSEVKSNIEKDNKPKVKIEDINQAILCNPRNAYQRYVCAVNSSDKVLYTYMGKLLPNFGNAHFAGAGCLNPLSNDPDYETIGMGTRIFLGGGVGYVIGEGTQHSPGNGMGAVFVKGDLKQMNSEFLRGVSYEKYGTSMLIGVGIPIPILNERLAKKTAINDEEILTDVIDYGIPRRDRPILRQVTYKELKSGCIKINDKNIKCASLSSISKSRKIAKTLKKWIQKGKFYLNPPAETLPLEKVLKPMKQIRKK